MLQRIASRWSNMFSVETALARSEGFTAEQIKDARKTFSADYYLAAAQPNLSPADARYPWLHYLTLGWRNGLDPSPTFSTTGYLDANPDVRLSGLNPLLHYVAYGRAEGRYAPAPGQWGASSRALPDVPWFMDLGARGKARWMECPPDLKKDVSFFLDHGYIKLEDSLAPEVVARAKDAFAAHKERYRALYSEYADPQGFQRRLCNLHMALDALKDLYTKNTRALRLQDYLFGAPAVCYSSLTFEAGSEQPLHRDSPYFCTAPEYYYLGVWVALEPVDAENGALEVIDGGHLVQEPDRFDIVRRYYREDEEIDQFDRRLWDDYQAAAIALCDEAEKRRAIVAMAPGDTLIWHPHLPHGGSIIRDPRRSRLSMVNHVVAKGAPLGGMRQFFHKAGRAPTPDYAVFEHEGREFVRHEKVGFGHKFEKQFDELLPA
jgi:phytanoyl-CoA hydroxylase